jgi:hypothetical protein
MPILTLNDNSLTGDDVSIAIAETQNGNHGAFKLSYRGETTRCIAFDAPPDLKGLWGVNKTVTPLTLSMYTQLIGLSKVSALEATRTGYDPNSANGFDFQLLWSDADFNEGDVRQKNPPFDFSVIYPATGCDQLHCTSPGTDCTTESFSVSTIGLNSWLTRLDLASKLPAGETLNPGDVIKISTAYSSAASSTQIRSIVAKVNCTRYIVDRPFSQYHSGASFTIKKVVPAQKAKVKFINSTTVLTVDRNIAHAVSGAASSNAMWGTRENAVCSNRGLCNEQTGLCECFSGYGAEACQLQITDIHQAIG